MKLTLRRMTKTKGAVIGRLDVNGEFNCYTLEDPDGAGDRIDAGTYNVIIDDSTRFKRKMPHIIGSAAIDDRGIRIHSGNTQFDTEGCILVGTTKGVNEVEDSRDAFNALFSTLESTLSRGELVSLEVLDEIPPNSPTLPCIASPLTVPRLDNVVSLATSLLQRFLSHLRPS